MTQQGDAKQQRRPVPPRVVAPPPGEHSLAGKVAVVIGGSRSVGGVVATGLAREGAAVAFLGRDETAVEAVTGAVRTAGGRVHGATADTTRMASVGQARQDLESALGPVDIVVFFGTAAGRPVRVARMAPRRWRTVVDGNLNSAFIALRQFAPGMAARGKGSIVIVGSAAGRAPGLANAAFSAANAGLAMLTRQSALELARRGVRVNMVAAGGVLTEQLEGRVPEQRRARLAAAIPLGRFGHAEDIGAAVGFLASDAAAWVTGTVLDVTGGRVTA